MGYGVQWTKSSLLLDFSTKAVPQIVNKQPKAPTKSTKMKRSAALQCQGTECGEVNFYSFGCHILSVPFSRRAWSARRRPAGGGGVRFAHSRRKGHIKCGNSFGFLDPWWYGGRSNSLSLDLLWSYVVGYLPLKLARAAFSARMLLFCSCRFLSLGLPGSAGPSLSLSLYVSVARGRGLGNSGNPREGKNLLRHAYPCSRRRSRGMRGVVQLRVPPSRTS